ncbi:MAG: hypothetical protein V4494_03805 [Chlamydiota bacterium]
MSIPHVPNLNDSVFDSNFNAGLNNNHEVSDHDDLNNNYDNEKSDFFKDIGSEKVKEKKNNHLHSLYAKPKADAKYRKSTTVNDKFKPVAQHMNAAVSKVAFYGASKSALSMTSAVFANQAYILGQSDSPFIDGLRARADFLEAAAMSATSTIINFFYAIGATVLAAGAFGQSETMNAAFTRNWMHTKVAFKVTVAGSVGGLTPGGAAYFYKGAVEQVATSLKQDIANILQAAHDSKLSSSELTRALVAYLKTELAGAGKNGMLLAQRIAPSAIEFLAQATEIKIKSSQAEEIAAQQKADKEALKGKNKEQKKDLKEIQEKAMKTLEKKQEKALSKNREFFKSLSETVANDSTFESLGTSLSNTLDVISNNAKGKKGEKAVVENFEIKARTYDAMSAQAAKSFIVSKAKQELEYIQNNPVQVEDVSKVLLKQQKAAEKLEASKGNKKILDAANKAVRKEKEANEAFAQAEQDILVRAAEAKIAMLEKRIEMLDEYTKLKAAQKSITVARKEIKGLGSKKENIDRVKELRAEIKDFSKEEKALEKSIKGIYQKSLRIQEKALEKEIAKETKRLTKLSTEVEDLKKVAESSSNRNEKQALQAKIDSALEKGEAIAQRVNAGKGTLELKLDEVVKEKETSFSSERIVSDFMNKNMDKVSSQLDKIVEGATGDDSIFNDLYSFGKGILGAIFSPHK